MATSLASVGMGNLRISRNCSPCRSMRGSKLGTISSNENGGSALKGGITPKVGMTWKFSSPSYTKGRSVRLAPIPRSKIVSNASCTQGGGELTVEDYIPLGVLER